MAANVIESLHRAGVATNDDDTFARDVAKKIIAGVRDVVRPSGADPIFEKEALNLAAKEAGVCVIASRQCFGNRAQKCHWLVLSNLPL